MAKVLCPIAEEKYVTIAMLRDEFLRGYVQSLNISTEVNDLMRISLEIVVTEATQTQLNNLVTLPSEIAIIKLR